MNIELQPQIVTLDNGLRLVLTELPYARSVSISIYVSAGSRYEATNKDAGLSHFVEHLCFKGTDNRPDPRTIAAEIDSLGGSFNAATDRELTVYYAKVTPERSTEALELLVDLVRNSRFRDEEIERERRVILEEIAAVEDAPDEQVSVLLDGLLWPNEPLGRDIAGTPNSITNLSAQRLRDYYQEQYVANSAVISIAGALTTRDAMARIEPLVKDWPSGNPTDWVRVGKPPKGPQLRLLEKETEQTHLSLGMRSLDAYDDDRYALGLLSILLGEGMSSRLFIRLREELGLCYDVHSSTSYLRDTGTFTIHAGIDPTNTLETVREIVSALAHARLPIESAELERAKQQVQSRIQLQLEDNRAISAWYGSRLALDLPLREPEETIALFEQVTIENLQQVARRLIKDEHLQLAVIGPITDAAALEGAMKLEP